MYRRRRGKAPDLRKREERGSVFIQVSWSFAQPFAKSHDALRAHRFFVYVPSWVRFSFRELRIYAYYD